MFIIRPIYGFVQSIILVITLLTTSGHFVPNQLGCYLWRLDRMGIYDNRTRDSVPQTELFDLVMDHFQQEREDNRTPRAIMIVYDGARADVLRHTQSSDESGIFALQREGGHVYHMHTGGPCITNRNILFHRGPWWRGQQDTSTAAAFATMLTGRWAIGSDGHGVLGNGYTKPVDSPPLIFQPLLEQNYVNSAAFVVSWNGHFTRTNAEGVPTSNYANDVVLYEELGLNMTWSMNPDDDATIATTIGMLENANGPGFVVVSLEHVDSAGHRGGFGDHNLGYIEAFRESERAGLAMIDAIRARPTYDQEDWLIMITSDHGGYSIYHGRQFQVARQVFLAVNRDLGW